MLIKSRMREIINIRSYHSKFLFIKSSLKELSYDFINRTVIKKIYLRYLPRHLYREKVILLFLMTHG